MTLSGTQILSAFQELLSSDDPNLGLVIKEFSADYTYRVGTGFRNRAALDSLTLLEPSDPLYGYGVYGHIAIEKFDEGALLYLSPHIICTPEMWLIRSALELPAPRWEGDPDEAQRFYVRRTKLLKKVEDPSLIERLVALRITATDGYLQSNLSGGIGRVNLTEALDRIRAQRDNDHAANE